MYIIEIIPEEKRIGIKSDIGCGMEMSPNELREIADAYEKENWEWVRECCEKALSW